MPLNPEWTRILCISLHPQMKDSCVPEALQSLIEWTWSRSACVRCDTRPPGSVGENDLRGTACVLLDWRGDSLVSRIPSGLAAGENPYRDLNEAVQHIRGLAVNMPIILYREATAQPDVIFDKLCASGMARCLRLESLTDESLVTTFAEAGIQLPPCQIRVSYPQQHDPFLAGLVEQVGGEDALKLAIQKFFPTAQHAYVDPVSAGWSGTKLCKVTIDKQPPGYFMKFYRDRREYIREVNNHKRATIDWLGDVVVPLRYVPEMAQTGETQVRAFSSPYGQRPVACYESAHPRTMLTRFYSEEHPDAEIDLAMSACLEALKSRQNDDQAWERLWEPERFDSVRQEASSVRERQARILATADDLQPYDAASLGALDGRRWEDRIREVVAFACGVIPNWLQQLLHVHIGHVHGDPNPRNWLVDEGNPADVRVIDCGDYSSSGRLVSDLAIMERDAKFVLLGTEFNAGGFRDLDTTQLPEWAKAEVDSIKIGIGYADGDAKKVHASATRAFQLVARIRGRAKELNGKDDPCGQHYFAALLYWTLDMLRYEAIRRTKRWLALLSAAEILRRF
jgi:hypothetical protein